MLTKIISGCQTGADIAGIDAAIQEYLNKLGQMSGEGENQGGAGHPK